ncbi:MAG: hypothetical protein WC010_02890 [Candidatus Absconditabacterales bacterium]
MKKIILIGIFVMMIGISTATEIKFSPDNGDIQKGCLIATDIFIDTEDNKIAATDIVIESSLEYLDFVPSKNLFPYFFPPKTGDNIIHIIGFISDPKNTITGSGSIGKIFFRKKSSTDTDGSIKLFFAGQGETYDSNLSILGGIDVLQNVGSGYYNFTDNGPCQYPADYEIVGGFSHMSAEDALNETIKTIKRQQFMEKLLSWQTLIGFAGLLIIVTILFIYIKKRKQGVIK